MTEEGEPSGIKMIAELAAWTMMRDLRSTVAQTSALARHGSLPPRKAARLLRALADHFRYPEGFPTEEERVIKSEIRRVAAQIMVQSPRKSTRRRAR